MYLLLYSYWLLLFYTIGIYYFINYDKLRFIIIFDTKYEFYEISILLIILISVNLIFSFKMYCKKFLFGNYVLNDLIK